MIDGATENGLPESYIGYLKTLPVFLAGKSTRARLGAFLFLAFFRRAVRVLAWSTKLIVNDKGHCPQILGSAIIWFYWFMWSWHDHIHSRLWGSGDGAVLRYDGLQLL